MVRKSVLLPPFVIDAGNAFVKWAIDDIAGLFVHKVAMLTPNEYLDGLNRYGKTATLDFIELEGNAYAVGATAENYNVQHRRGAPKYKREYYGVLLASAIARAFYADPTLLSGGIKVTASHASRDYEFHKQLIASIKGRWNFKCGGKSFNFNISTVETYEEPFGGYALQAFQKDRRGIWTAPLAGVAVGVIDIGGGTCGTLAVNEDGTVQYGTAASGSQGVNNAVDRLKSLLKTDFPDYFQMGADMSEKRLRDALKQEKYTGGGRTFDCSKQVSLALAPLLNEVENMYIDKLNGGGDSDVIILTGGGMEILHEKVIAITKHGNVRLAAELGALQGANVQGAKIFNEVLESV